MISQLEALYEQARGVRRLYELTLPIHGRRRLPPDTPHYRTVEALRAICARLDELISEEHALQQKPEKL